MNILIALFYIISLILTLLTLHGDIITCACNTVCSATLAEYRLIDLENICNHSTYYRTLFWVSVGLGLTMIVLQILGCYYGLRLINHQYFKIRIHTNPVLTTVPVTTKTVYQETNPYYVVHDPHYPVHLVRVPPPNYATVVPNGTVMYNNNPYASYNGSVSSNNPNMMNYNTNTNSYTYASPPNQTRDKSSIDSKGSRSRSSSNP